MMKKNSFALIILSVLIFAGCKQNVNEEKFYDFTINVKTNVEEGSIKALEDAYSKEQGISVNNGRTANPEVPSTIYYTVVGEKDGKTVNSVWDGDEKYSIRLSEGTWTLVAKGFKTNTDGTFSTQIFQSSSWNVNVDDSITDKIITIDVFPILKDETENTIGYVKLPVGIAADSEIVAAKAVWTTSDGNSAEQELDLDSTDTTPKLTADFYMGANENASVSTGAHSVSFYFYKKDSTGNPYLAYFFTETINVFANLTTTKWTRASEKSKYMSADGVINVTKALVEAFEQNTRYVDTGDSGSDSAAGTYFSPFKTVQKALDVVVSMNTGAADEEYAIVLKSDVIADSTTDLSENSDSYIDLTSDNSLNLSIFGMDTVKKIDAARTSTATGRVINIGTNVNLTLRNVEITGGYLAGDSTLNGAGIFVGGTLSIEGNVSVYGNQKGTTINNNIYLPKKADGTQKTISVLGALIAGSNGRIGVTTETKPAFATPRIPFTSGFGTNSNSETSSSFFTSDDGYAIGLNSGEAVIATTKLSFEPEIMTNIIISIDSGSQIISKTEGGIITLAAISGETDITDKITEWKIIVTNGGGIVTTSSATEIDSSATVSINTNRIIFHKGLPKGLYQVEVIAKYENQTTDGAKDGFTFDVEIQ